MEILTRTTSEPCLFLNDVRAAQNIIANNRLDYLMVDNHGDVNAFYYANGELNVLKPHTTDILLSVRDNVGRVISYPSLFFDKASYGQPITFRIGICSNCRNSTIGVQYGLLYNYKKGIGIEPSLVSKHQAKYEASWQKN
jgi:hypothetical protein